MIDFSDIRYVDTPVLSFYPPYEFQRMRDFIKQQGIEIKGKFFRPREITKEHPEWHAAREETAHRYEQAYDGITHPMAMCGYLSNIDPQWFFEKIKFFYDERCLDPDYVAQEKETARIAHEETEKMIADGRIILPPHLR